MSIIMDFTMTAMARHEIVNNTLKSFSKNLKGINLKDCRLIVNIDPLPPKVKRKNVIKIGRRYFGDVIYNLPPVANFTAACNWVWSNAETEYIFHVEDDWELTTPISVPKILRHFENNETLLQVILRAYRYRYETCSLSPSVMHKRFYSKLAGNLNTKLNPEIQLRGERFGLKMPRRGRPGISTKGLIVVYPRPSKRIVLKDLGRAWINGTKYRKTGKGKKSHFITWETRK